MTNRIKKITAITLVFCLIIGSYFCIAPPTKANAWFTEHYGVANYNEACKMYNSTSSNDKIIVQNLGDEPIKVRLRKGYENGSWHGGGICTTIKAGSSHTFSVKKNTCYTLQALCKTKEKSSTFRVIGM